MKNFGFALLLSIISFTVAAQQEPTQITLKNEIVDASCGVCKLGLKGKKCELAVRINQTSYFVDGTTIKDHGDSHAKDGFCNAIKQAKVSGKVIDGRFKSTAFKVVKAPKSKEGTSK